ncbi:hypothetical protein HDE78_000315 [Rhodanobacter sp. K2T2]|uniref:hypothetical protein n=1 Tax=Rhodanobacter sp. K2T2 TaxID=2723085 RepID=UPI0015C8A578|nr:hypothetical protein [Rhodanobacter sp. K2T2]NYE27390.1 hypothetical protein [Rhodanobacter sp. K2T2]
MESGSTSTTEMPHGEQTFGVRTCRDMFRKMYFEVAEFTATRSSDRDMAVRGFRALNAAWTIWHLHDWVFEEHMDAGDEFLALIASAFPGVDFSQKANQRQRLTLFADELSKKFDALDICRTLATAGKHAKATSRPRPDLRAIEVQPIEWMPPGTQGPICFDVRVLVGNQPWDARDLFVQAIADWRQFFALIGQDVPDIRFEI